MDLKAQIATNESARYLVDGNNNLSDIELSKNATYRAEMTSLVSIIRDDKIKVYAHGGSKVGLILGLIMTMGMVITSFYYINKNRKKLSEDYDEGGSVDDFYEKI